MFLRWVEKPIGTIFCREIGELDARTTLEAAPFAQSITIFSPRDPDLEAASDAQNSGSA